MPRELQHTVIYDVLVSVTAAGKWHGRLDYDTLSRKMTAEFAAGTGCTGYMQICLMPAENVLDDSEAKAHAPILARPAAVDPEESLGESRNVVLRNTLTVITDNEVGAISISTPGQRDLSSRCRVPDCIRYEVANDRFDFIQITAQLRF